MTTRLHTDARPRAHRLALLVAPLAASLLMACGDGDDGVQDDTQAGQFTGSPVAGLDYRTDTQSGSTDANGGFRYRAAEQVTFTLGNLAIGSATGAATLNALSVTPGAATATEPAVQNKLVLLQTLDVDGNLNNGIQITPAIRSVVSARAAGINFSQPTAAFRTSLDGLLQELNTANVFTDTDPRARTARATTAALEHYQRATAERQTVTVAQGQLRGYGATPTTWQYLGVPYAQPPLANLRWRPPQAPVAWTGVRDAVAWGDQAPQNPSYQAFGEGGMSEDSLYLNVTAPRNANNLPVMVWFHGGGFVILSGNTKAFNNAASLPTKDVVLVSVSHRLGPFGYLANPQLSAEAGQVTAGNYGQLDLIAALQWVRANIRQFGGNPDNVTIFGESGGGGKVLSLMNSPMATGLFHKAIVQSGQAEAANTVLNGQPQSVAENIGTGLFNRLGAATPAEARAKTWIEIVNAELAHYPNGDYRAAYGPVVDGRYAPRNLAEGIRAGLPNDVPLLAGANNGDLPGLITGLIEQTPLRAQFSRSPQYIYKFTRVPTGWANGGVLSYHGGELVYVFNYPPSLVSHSLLGLVIDPATGRPLVIGDINGNGITGTAGDAADVFASAGYGATDAAVAQTMMDFWTNFARTGNPSTSSFTWPAYSTSNDAYVEIGASPQLRSGLATAFQ